MKIKYIQLLFVSMFIAASAYSQHQLYFENFEGSTNSFTLNDTIFGNNYGNNKFIVNNVYTGAIGHPTTISEDSTYGGTISYAPHGHYLHIYDSASGFTNDNYNPNDSSIRFAHMTTGVCTKSLSQISFNFFYLCQGSPTAFGTVYYSVNGGPWTSTGTTLNRWLGDTLDNRHKWQYATVTNPAFANVEDLRLGFGWHNDKTAGKDTTSLGIDDVSMTGIYDSVAHPITCSFNLYSTDSCTFNGPFIFLGATINDSTCASTWDIYMSNDIGNYPGTYAWYQTVSPSFGNDIFQYWYLTFPSNANLEGHCFRFKLVRTSYPYLVFQDSICYHFDSTACPPDTIVTFQPPATLSDSVCAGSVIDVPFTSQGPYTTYNVYYCQLIDSVGNTATIDTIGYLTSNIDYPYPYNPYGPGDIIATIPLTAPPGCNYYLKVVSTTPNRKAYAWGPFCIRHCEIKTNDQQPIQVCLHSCAKEPHGYNDTIVFADSVGHYYPGNDFEVQVISFMLWPPSFSIVNTGLLGVKADTAGGHFKFILHVPCPDTLNANGIIPGEYYMRIVADSSTYPDSSLGSLIHLTIGEPADSIYITVSSSPPGPPYCTNSTLTFSVIPDDQYTIGSSYEWWFTDKRSGTFPETGVSGGSLGLNPVADTFLITVQETNNGCKGPKATISDSVVVTGEPNVTKTGPTYVCLSDTGVFSIPFANNTDYVWTISAKAHADTANNVLKIKFDTIGVVTIKVKALNVCFTDSATWTVHVIATPVPVITANPTGTFCAGTKVNLTVTGANTYKWSTGKTGSSINVVPTKDTSYWVNASNQGCTIKDTVKLNVLATPVIQVNPASPTVCNGDTITLKATGANSYSWTPNTGIIKNQDSLVTAIVNGSQTYTVSGAGSDGCHDTTTVSVGVLPISGAVGTATSIVEGASVTLTSGGGSTYLWSPSAGLSCDTCENTIATPSVTTTYTVLIKDANGCLVNDTVTVDVIPNCDLYVPDAFSPGNPNNKNIILYVRTECPISGFDFIVFDRWGNKVFESKDLSIGWDGNLNGKPMNAATFVYSVSGTAPNGKNVAKKGNVALIR